MNKYSKLSIIELIAILFLVYNPEVSQADDVGVLCVNKFDGLISTEEKKCQLRIESDDKYARKKRFHLRRSFPECDVDNSKYIDAGKEEVCATGRKKDDYNQKESRNRALAKLHPSCDGVDRGGVIHEDQRDGEISGVAEKKCVRQVTALLAAIHGSDVGSLVILLDEGVNIEGLDMKGNSALTLAGVYGNPEIIEALLTGGAKIDGRDNDGSTVLMNAAGKGREKVVDLLIKNGADIDLKSENGSTALFFAIRKGNAAVVTRLLKAGAGLSLKNKKGSTALVVASYYNNTDVVKALLDAGAGINSVDYRGSTALMNASASGNVDVVELLLKQGADFTVVDGEGRLAINLAINKERNLVVEALLHFGDRLPVRGISEIATKPVDLKLLNIIIQSDVDIDAVDEYGNTYLHYSVANKTVEEARCISSVQSKMLSGVLVNPLDKNPCVKGGDDNLAAVKRLIEKKCDVNVRNDDGETAVFRAASHSDNNEIVKVLLNAGSDLNLVNNNKQNTLHKAVQNLYQGSIGMVRMLIKGGARVDDKDRLGKTPLHYAVSNSYHRDGEIIRMLINAGANIHAEDLKGSSPLTIAMERGRSKNIIEAITRKPSTINHLKINLPKFDEGFSLGVRVE